MSERNDTREWFRQIFASAQEVLRKQVDLVITVRQMSSSADVSLSETLDLIRELREMYERHRQWLEEEEENEE